MAEFGMWGPAEAGERIAELDRYANANKAASTAHLLAQNELIPAQKAQAEAHARLFGAQAAEKEAEVLTQQKIAAMLSGASRGELSEDPDVALDRVGMVQLQAGAFKAAGETLGRAASIRARNSRALNQEAGTALSELRGHIETLKAVGGLAGSVRNQADLDRAHIIGAANGLNLEGIPRDYASAAPMLGQLAEASMTAAQQATARAKEIEAEAKRTSEADQRTSRRSQRELNAARIRDMESRAIARERNAGKPVGSASTNEVTQAGSFIRQQLGATVDGAELTAGAVDLANTARGLMKRNPGLDYSQAMAQAFNAEDWETSKPMFGKPTAKRSGKTPKSALPLPADVKSRQDGAFYQTPKGVGQWDERAYKQTGNGWRKATATNLSAVEEDDDDEDDE